MTVKRVAVIGAGPAGVIALDALMRERRFDLVRVFERRNGPGGCWSADGKPPPTISNIRELATRSADGPLQPPKTLPAVVPRSHQHRFSEATVYPYLETNVVAEAMQFTEEPFPTELTNLTKDLYGPQSPFRHWKAVQRYIESLVQRRGYGDLVSYDTFVENVVKNGAAWTVTLRKAGAVYDYWWQEEFDAVVVANGHYNVPFIPAVDGLELLEKSRPGSVIHSKQFRGRHMYRDRRVVVVGASVSAADIAFDLTNVAKLPVHAVVINHRANVYFGDEAFKHPNIQRQHSLVKVVGRTAHFEDGTYVEDVDHFIFGTGYTWTLPFLPSVPIRNNRVPDLYQHVVWQHDSTLLFVGAVNAGLTFKIFEWQAVYAARLLAERGTLPPLDERVRWEKERIEARGDGPKFALVYPDFEEYFETLRRLAGDGDGVGRQLPKFQREWFRDFMDGHELRKGMWKRLNVEARKRLNKDLQQTWEYARL
ncbi:FAD/NAD(P)-binding domain-containing protein [Teratosphaeria nubilosa]|uniref:FAD/NAD(P)-binding domain-containing protein n=1 Tax=Teratosphaeria nubilosa TaxID=161662 RepID=A0A6G1KTM2_9PEZI|nr:FAD/NAD(P)-binding domain-containing protein [Teratosphaeria nubilosa]